jgi:acetyl esterase/lipase
VTAFHSDLRLARFMPRISIGPRSLQVLQRAKPRAPKPAPPDVCVEDVTAPGAWGAPGVSLRLYRPAAAAAGDGPMPALLWIHGGGYVLGRPEGDDQVVIEMVRGLRMTVASLRYRLSPAHRAPAALEDAYSGLTWLFASAQDLGVDRSRIAIAGASAGGGLAAALALLARDRQEMKPAFQLLVYPMLDDRTAMRTDLDMRYVRGWQPGSNRFAWEAYLGQKPGLADAPDYVVPARCADVRGLAPAWIGVGTLDLFYDEDVEYARRLRGAGVACELHVVPGAFHGFDEIFRRAAVSRDFRSERVRVLGDALLVTSAT